MTPESVFYPSFKIVGDNIDKSIKPSEETSESHNRSLHYFHSYAVKDRTDVSNVDDSPSLPILEDINVLEVLPSTDDKHALKQNMAILAGEFLINLLVCITV